MMLSWPDSQKAAARAGWAIFKKMSLRSNMLFSKAENFHGGIVVTTKISEAQCFELGAEGRLYQNLELFNLKTVIFDTIPSHKSVLKVLFSFLCGIKTFLEP